MATPEALCPSASGTDLPPQMHRLYSTPSCAWQRYADFADRGGVLSPPCPDRLSDGYLLIFVSRFAARRRPVAETVFPRRFSTSRDRGRSHRGATTVVSKEFLQVRHAAASDRHEP